MINALLLFLGFMFIVSFVWTYYLVSYKGTSAFTELSSTASNLFTGIVHLATAVTAWIRTNLNLICTWGPITILVFGSILIGLFFFGYAWTRNTQALATGTNDILTGPFHDFLVAFANTTETLKEGAEPAILLYDSWVGMARLFTSPAIEIAFDCTEFSWATLLNNVVKILWSGYNSVIKFIAGIIYPDDTSGYFDFYTPLYEIGQSIASIKGILVCECRLLSFYFEYLSNLVSDPNLWHSIDRVLNFIIATVYQIIFSLIQFIQFFFALITGQWTAVWDYFFDNAYGYPDYFELSTIIRDAIAKSGWSANETRWIIPHQANGRILKAAAKRSGVPFQRFYLNVERVGNTSSASIPVALIEVEDTLQPGDKLILCSVGAGVTTAAASIEW